MGDLKALGVGSREPMSECLGRPLGHHWEGEHGYTLGLLFTGTLLFPCDFRVSQWRSHKICCSPTHPLLTL